MSARLKGPSLFKLILMFAFVAACQQQKSNHQVESKRQSRQQAVPFNYESSEQDPMEPCYLANNRASESLTISESTPVGTVVGEIMVNGDSSTNGNIELSIKMPAGQQQLPGTQTDHHHHQQQQQQASAPTSRLVASGAQWQGSRTKPPPASSANYSQLGASFARRNGTPLTDVGGTSDNSNGNSNLTTTGKSSQSARQSIMQSETSSQTARDLTQLIDLMPPLTIEQGTRRLILAKKLDRENLDRYIAAGGYQASQANVAQHSSSSASLTVHVKCQLRSIATSGSNSSGLRSGEKAQIANKNSLTANSILIPVHLIVTDENDNWPVFVNSPYIIDLNESAQVGTLLAGNEILATDLDQQGPFSTIEYSIVAGSLWSSSFTFLNPLDSSSLVVKDNRLLDYESQSKLALKIMARDQGEPPNWAISSLYVNLLDQDDQSPLFNEDKYNGYVKDNRPGELVDILPRRMLARDADKSLDSPVAYSFHAKTNQSIHFELDADLGALRLRKSLPEELAASRQPFCLLVRASQVDNPRRWSVAPVNVRVARAPVMDSAGASHLEQLLTLGETTATNLEQYHHGHQPIATLRFQQSNYTLEVSESAPIGFTLMNLRASLQAKAGKVAAEQISYQILDDSSQGHFDVDETTGRLTLNRTLDYEMYRQLSFRVLATLEYHDPSDQLTRAANDEPKSKLLCDVTRINVKVMNNNEFAPEFSHEQYNFQLSISDLIASFEPPAREQDHGGSNEVKRKRSAEPDDVDQSDADHPTASKAMLLGQVYCADRDHGDRVSLQLLGSKASLFQLTQDGHLYLPLVNLTSLGGQQQQQPAEAIARRNDFLWPPTKGLLGGQFAVPPSRVFSASRRSDQPLADLPDRRYLNYLLGELSNLGRLRLKVLASDDGGPQAFQSSALIVVSVISIDNFILQKGAQGGTSGDQMSPGATHLDPTQSIADPTLNADSPNPTTLADSQSSSSSPPPGKPDPFQPNQLAAHRLDRHQLMMIPSANGKDFVQINSDIIGNLLMARNHGASSAINELTAAGITNRSDNQDSLQAAASNAIGSSSSSFSLLHGGSQVNSRPQPPSLLMVDDVGVKLVAMQAALEVYNRQVQEAADQQQSQAKRRKSIVDPSAAFGASPGDSGAGQSAWGHVRSYFGYNDEQPRWSSVLGVATFHLLALVLIIGLVYRSRAIMASGGSSSSFVHSRGRPAGLLSAFFGRSSDSSFQASASVGILDKAASSYSSGLADNNLSSSERSDSPNYAFVRRQKSNNYRNRQRQAAPISKGLVVSAISVPPPPQSQATRNGSLLNSPGSLNSDAKQQQNLLGHLRQTLNRMLDSQETGASDDFTNQTLVNVTRSDSSLVLQEYGNPPPANQLANGASISPPLTSPSNLGSSPSPQTDSRRLEPPAAAGKSSTFLGFSSPQTRNTSSVKSNSAETKPTTLVINVKAPKEAQPKSARADLEGAKPETSQAEQSPMMNSNSSSFVSLVSMSSSISNKINAAIAVEQPAHERATGSDSSSVDSASMFKALFQNNSSPAGSGGSGASSSASSSSSAPPPPPPPPVPLSSLVDSSRRDRASPKTNSRAAKPPASHMEPQNKCRPLPQNPVHVKLRQQAKQPAPIRNTADCSSSTSGNASAGSDEGQRPCGQSSSRTKELIREAIARKLAEQQAVQSPQVPPPSPPVSISRSFEYSQPKRSASHYAGAIPPPPSITISPGTGTSRLGSPAAPQMAGRGGGNSFAPNHRGAGRSKVSAAQHTPRLAPQRPPPALPATRRAPARPSSPPVGERPSSECSLEDRDFYYCYQDHDQPATGASLHPAAFDRATGLLDDYLVHAYQSEASPEVGGHESGAAPMELMRQLQQHAATIQPMDLTNLGGSSNLAAHRSAKSAASHPCQVNLLPNDLRTRSHPTRRMHQRPQRATCGPPEARAGSSTGRRRPQQVLTGYQPPASSRYDFSQAANKKQLTWSDQVGVAR